jgi:hypothetical protein
VCRAGGTFGRFDRLQHRTACIPDRKRSLAPHARAMSPSQSLHESRQLSLMTRPSMQVELSSNFPDLADLPFRAFQLPLQHWVSRRLQYLELFPMTSGATSLHLRPTMNPTSQSQPHIKDETYKSCGGQMKKALSKCKY